MKTRRGEEYPQGVRETVMKQVQTVFICFRGEEEGHVWARSKGCDYVVSVGEVGFGSVREGASAHLEGALDEASVLAVANVKGYPLRRQGSHRTI